MELRLLSMEKRGDNYWVYEAHPATPDKKTITHTSEHTIANMHDYERFQEVNNTAVKYAHELGIDLSEKYPKFFELGFRVSQQLGSVEKELEDRIERLGGQVKYRTMPKYWEAEWDLQNTLKKGIARHYALKAHDELEKIASPELMEGVPEEYQATIADYVDRLQRVPFPKDETGQVLYPTLPKEEFEVKGSFNMLIDGLVRDLKGMASPTTERYAQVPVAARSEFLALCRYEDLFGEVAYGSWFELDGSQEELLGLVKGIEGIAVRNFFKALRLELGREDKFNEFMTMIRHYLDPKSGYPVTTDQQPLFFELMVTAQEENVPDYRESIAGEAARLFGDYSEVEVRDIVAQVFEMVKSGEGKIFGRDGFFERKLKERKTA